MKVQGPGPKPCALFQNMLCFYGGELFVLHQTPKLEDHPLLAVKNCLFNILAATLYIWRLSPLSATRRCALSCWQGLSYNGYSIKYCIKLGRFTLLQWPCLSVGVNDAVTHSDSLYLVLNESKINDIFKPVCCSTSSLLIPCMLQSVLVFRLMTSSSISRDWAKQLFQMAS